MTQEITCLFYPHAAGARQTTLLVMLPGVGIQAGAFADRGMVAAVHGRGLAVDIIATHPRLDLYLDGDFAAALHRLVIEPAQARGYARIWLLGISLGGMGALLYASHDQAAADGIILLAPFLGTQGTIAAIAASGGIAGLPPDAGATALERQMLAWLRQFLAAPPIRPKIYLGYGQADRFAPGHLMLANMLPADRVVTDAGGHDWPTWLALWGQLLDASPFAANGGAVP